MTIFVLIMNKMVSSLVYNQKKYQLMLNPLPRNIKEKKPSQMQTVHSHIFRFFLDAQSSSRNEEPSWCSLVMNTKNLGVIILHNLKKKRIISSENIQIPTSQ